MLVIVNGTLGVGKTWIARWLLSQLEDAAYIEGDILRFVSPSLTRQQSKDQLALDVALDLMASYRRKGAKIIVLDFLFTETALYDSFIQRSGCQTYTFYLSASPKVLATRIQKRGRPQADWEIAQATEIEKRQRTALSGNRLGIEISTDDLSPEQIVDQIKSQLSI